MSYTFSTPSAATSLPQPAGKALGVAAPKPGSKGFSFWDLVDIVNPLQHIPIVSNIYRNVTGDEIGPVARIAGGALFGGFVGAALGGINAVAVNKTGEDIGQMAMDKVGFTAKAKSKPAPDENSMVVEVHASAKYADKDNGIVWDDAPKPIAQALAPIIWDTPVAMAKSDRIDAERRSDKNMPIAAAMPSPKDLNDLEPGALLPAPVVAETAPQKEDVPKNMMQALAKYEAMQRLGKPEASTNVAQNTAQPFSGLGKIRRYN